MFQDVFELRPEEDSLTIAELLQQRKDFFSKFLGVEADSYMSWQFFNGTARLSLNTPCSILRLKTSLYLSRGQHDVPGTILLCLGPTGCLLILLIYVFVCVRSVDWECRQRLDQCVCWQMRTRCDRLFF